MKKPWFYDESKHCGIDYSDAKIAEKYDTEHSKFRDFDAEAKSIVDKLQIKKDSTVLEFGCGTGVLTIPIASYCSRIIGVDASQQMLDCLNKKVSSQQIRNIQVYCAGFLNYEHKSEPVDFIISKAALHHLPDFWKSVALLKIFHVLKPDGKFYLFDVAFSFKISEYEKNIDEWISAMHQSAGKKMTEEAITHVRDEYSTFDWILDELLQKIGFNIESKEEEQPNCFSYICSK